MFISAIAFQKNSVLLLGKKVGRNFWQPSVVKKSGKFGLNGIYIVNSVNRGKITMTGFDPIFGITGYHLMLCYNGVRYNGVDFVLCIQSTPVYSPTLLAQCKF